MMRRKLKSNDGLAVYWNFSVMLECAPYFVSNFLTVAVALELGRHGIPVVGRRWVYLPPDRYRQTAFPCLTLSI